jgi:integrase
MGARYPTGTHMTERLTDGAIANIEPAAKDIFRFDRLLSGYGVRVTPAGARILFVQARFAGRKIRHAVGRWPDVKVAVGRELAVIALSDIRRGCDPKFERKARQRAAAAGGIVVAEFAETWLREHVRGRVKASTYADYESRLRLHILPRLGHLPVANLTWNDANKLHVAMAATPRTANYALDILRNLLACAVKVGLRSDNPVTGIEKYQERKHERFLSREEFPRAIGAIDSAERDGLVTTHVAAGLKLLAYTGARRSEIANARWSDIDFERRFIRLSDSKGNVPRTIHLNESALAILRTLPRVGPYIVAGGRSGPYKGLSTEWSEVRARCGLNDVRLHDLRHSYASSALAAGVPLATVGKLLGHRRARTTERYGHLSQDHVAAANDVVGAALKAAIEAKPPLADKVVKLHPRRRAAK